MASEDLSTIQDLFALAGHYRMKNLESIVDDNKILTDFVNILDDLDAAIQEKMPIATSPNYNRYVAMKAISYNMRTQVNFTVNREYTDKALALLDPIKLTPEGFNAYLQSSFDMSLSMEQHSDNQIIVYLNDAMTAIDEFEKTKKVDLFIDEIFGFERTREIEHEHSTYKVRLNEQRYRFSVPLFKYYAILKNEKMMEKFIIPAIQGIFMKQTSMHTVFNVLNFKPEKYVPQISDHMEFLIKTRHFKQVNHLLSFLMFHLSKNQPFAEKNEVDGAKVLVSYWYAKWADEVLRYTYLMVTNPEDSDVLTNPIRTEMVRFEEFVEPGVEKYENLFPVEAVESAKKWQKVVKNGKIWFHRAIIYLGKTEQNAKTIFGKEKDATNLMKSLLEWEKKQIF